MSMRYDISGVNGNDLSFAFTLTSGSPAVPVNLTGLTLTVYLKATSVTPDALASTFTASTGVTITNAADGQFTWEIPSTSYTVDAPGSLWYRVDLAGGGVTETAMYGALILTAA